ncbi:hypothetical protein OQJ68_06915 [Microbulbifer thermotolerans]|uniref:Uncharacterized protein n=1 Tax=Microbulbifer thermotolerans TaxID=252514 RepID=A0AB35HYI4_MICTH|nr:hypothetical protein [Microbulbifer thermotolerans]MCX2801513.1 hypothetical protein [Microbulbifer thermotolerans]
MIRSIKKSLWFLILISPFASASQVEVEANTLSVDPSNLSLAGVCVKFEDTGSSHLLVNIHFPDKFNKRNFEMANMRVASGGGESTTFEIVPEKKGNYRKIGIVAVRRQGEMSDIQLEAAYGDGKSIPEILMLDTSDFIEIFKQAEIGEETKLNCGR